MRMYSNSLWGKKNKLLGKSDTPAKLPGSKAYIITKCILCSKFQHRVRTRRSGRKLKEDSKITKPTGRIQTNFYIVKQPYEYK